MSVAHSKHSTKTDGPDSSLVRPSDWNAAHTVTGDAPALTFGTTNTAGTTSTLLAADSQIALFDATNPAAIGAVAAGTAGIAARRDHVHATGAGTATTSAVGDAATIGSGPGAAMYDHRHGREAFAANAWTLGTAAVAGTATTYARKDDVIAAFDTTNPAAVGTAATGSAAFAARRDHVHATGASTPSTQALGDAAATGSGPAAAMTDHKHAMPDSSAGPDADITIDSTGAAGTAHTAARSGHGHKVATSASTPAAIGTAAAGTSGHSPSRDDHVHATGAGTPAATAAALATGTGPAAAMTDHVHTIGSGSLGTGLAVASGVVSLAALTAPNVIGIPYVILRTSDTAARNSGNTGTTLTNDDAAGGTLAFAITNSATATYWVEAYILVNAANTAMDFKMGWSATGLPTGATALWGSNPGAAALAGYGGGGVAISAVAMNAVGGTQPIGSSANTFGVLAQGVFFGGGNAGTITFAWAQNTADASNLTVKAGSFLRVTLLRA